MPDTIQFLGGRDAGTVLYKLWGNLPGEGCPHRIICILAAGMEPLGGERHGLGGERVRERA